MIPPSSLVTSQGWGLIDLPLRAAFSPAHPLARRDMSLAQTWGIHDRALREHRRSSGFIPRFLSKTPKALAWVTTGKERFGFLENFFS